MNYIVYDLEFNQKHPKNNDVESDISSSIPFEIIQIGAFKLNHNLQTISTFNRLIKPTVYTTIHPFIENLTKISNEQVDSCKTFPLIYEDFLKFIGDDESVLCIWGTADVRELIKNIEFHNLSSSSIPKNYIDIQQYASNYFNAPGGSRIGLRNSVDLLNITSKSEFHDAFNDAYYTTEVFKKIYDDTNMEPKLYVPKLKRRITPDKEEVDMVALINQFEKMYKREMSEEEKSIIKLSYIMGKTKQFLL